MFLIWKHNTQSKVKFNTISNENEITNNSEINEQISFFYKSIFQEKLPFPRNDLQAYLETMKFLKFLQSMQNNHNEKMVNSKEFYETLEWYKKNLFYH